MPEDLGTVWYVICPRCHTNARETTGVRGVFDCPGCTYVWKDQRVGEQSRDFEDYFSKA